MEPERNETEEEAAEAAIQSRGGIRITELSGGFDLCIRSEDA